LIGSAGDFAGTTQYRVPVHGVDYYDLLGVHENASTSEIRLAYRSLAKVMHPDAGGTAGKFRLLREAYETLSDPALRADYDRGDDEEEDEEPEPGPVPVPVVVRRARRILRDDPDYLPAQPDIPPDTITWWHEADGRRVALAPVARPDLRVVLGAIGGWLVVLIGVVLAAPGAPMVVILVLMLAAAGAVLVRLVRRHLKVRESDRAFIAQYGSRVVFGNPGTERAEQLTAELLDKYFTRLPGVRIFHGLAEPGSVFADVEHAVLCGRRLVLIESKMWLPGHYDVDEAGDLWRNDHPFRGGSVRLPGQIDALRRLWPELEIRGVLLIYPNRPGEVTTDITGDIPPMAPAGFIKEIGRWLAADSSTVDKMAFTAVLRQVV
jgi:hypothetical protein